MNPTTALIDAKLLIDLLAAQRTAYEACLEAMDTPDFPAAARRLERVNAGLAGIGYGIG